MPDESGASVQGWRVEPFEDEWWLYHTPSGEALIADSEAKARSLADHLNRTGWTWPHTEEGRLLERARDFLAKDCPCAACAVARERLGLPALQEASDV